MFPRADLMLGSSGLQFDYLVVGAGGAGGGALGGSTGKGGGGGAGQVKSGKLEFSSGTALAITVGAPGVGQVNDNGAPGGLSALGDVVTALGGGYGAAPLNHGGGGGNGGGGGSTNGGASAGGLGVDFNGAAGGIGHGGGGGGAGGVSPDGTHGGPGVAKTISGSAVTYGVGGGANSATTAGSGGDGAVHSDTVGDDRAGASGIRGVVIIRYAGTARATGGVITTVAGDTVHTFTASGVFTVL